MSSLAIGVFQPVNSLVVKRNQQQTFNKFENKQILLDKICLFSNLAKTTHEKF
jgi:hypothetical protein